MVPYRSITILTGKNHLNRLVIKATDEPKIAASGIKKLGAQHINPVKNEGSMPKRPFSL
jgi:hypothetical protein